MSVHAVHACGTATISPSTSGRPCNPAFWLSARPMTPYLSYPPSSCLALRTMARVLLSWLGRSSRVTARCSDEIINEL